MKNKSKKVALVVPFAKLYEEVVGSDSVKDYYYNAGSWEGQAQKIYLGVCAAAMFRMPPEKHSWAIKLARKIASNYDLNVIFINKEIWIIKPEYKKYLKVMMTMKENSPGWHLLRANLCGIPLINVDFDYHLRKGFGTFAR